VFFLTGQQNFDQMKIGIAADHGGFHLKESVKSWLTRLGHDVKDYGAYALNETDDFPDFIAPLAAGIVDGTSERGIAICGSGVGASVAANKVKGVRAALIVDSFSAHQGVEDDDMNMICLGGRVIGPKLAEDLILSFINAKFIGGERHRRRLDKVRLMEKGQL
jgi:ribose 5-phosphate isomerase B